MASQSFARFLIRRMLCTTLFFVGLIIVAFASSATYYLVRINFIEKYANTHAVPLRASLQENTNKSDVSPGDAFLAPSLPIATRVNSDDSETFHRLISRAIPTGHEWERQKYRQSIAPPYMEDYRVLRVNVPMSRQSVRNPTVPDYFAVWDDEDDHGHKVATPEKAPSRRRYVLAGLEAGKQYMLRLSFLGSPSVSFEMFLYQVRRSRLRMAGSAASPLDARGGPRHGYAAVPQDTELLVFATSRSNALEFNYEEEVWIEDMNEETQPEDGEEDDTQESRASTPLLPVRGAAASDDRYVPVVEVHPRTLSIPADPTRVPLVRFNLVLDPMSASLLPQVAVPLIICVAWAVAFVGYLVVYTCVSSLIAGEGATTLEG